jgi:hypothetical protein
MIKIENTIRVFTVFYSEKGYINFNSTLRRKHTTGNSVE